MTAEDGLSGAISEALHAVASESTTGSKSSRNDHVAAIVSATLVKAKQEAQPVAHAFELAFRKASMENILVGGTGGGACKAMIGAAIDLVREMVITGMVAASLLYHLLGDLLDALTHEECALVFDHMEARIDMFTSKQFHTPAKISLLRMCNRLQQRLSRARDTVFCGRVRMFLSMVYPLSEKSALNLYSKFNVENTTEFEDVGKGETLTNGSGGGEEIIDHALYGHVWTLQMYMSNMALCYTQWSKVSTSLEQIVESFESSKLTSSRHTQTKAGASERARDLNSDGGATPPLPGSLDLQTLYFPKYLTGKGIFNLQLNDVVIRRQLCIQMLILFTYLATTSRFKSDSCQLSESQLEWVEKFRERVFVILEDSAPKGSKYRDHVERFIARDELWATWKEQSCKPFERKEVQFQKRKRVQDTIKEDAGRSEKRLKFDYNESESTYKSTPDNVPCVEDFFDEAWVQLDPKNGIEEEYLVTNDDLWCWRAMRCLGKSKYFFEPAFTKDYPKQQGPKSTKGDTNALFVASLRDLEKVVKGKKASARTSASTPEQENQKQETTADTSK